MLLKVYGHPRSGNHLLASLLHEHLFGSDESLALEVHAKDTGHWSRRRRGAPPPTDTRYTAAGDAKSGPARVPYAGLLGTHHLTPLVRPGSIYIFRDGRDVALSVYHWARFRRADQENIGIDEYLRTPIDWAGTPGVSVPPSELLFTHWYRHVAAWLDAGVFAVRYESLVLTPQVVLTRIAKHFSLAPPAAVTQQGPVGWNATAASNPHTRIAKWRSEMPEASRLLYDALVPDDFAGRWDR